MSNREFIVVLITAPSLDEGERIGESLVNAKLAACVNIIPSLKSIFFWEGKLCKEDEVLLVVKSRKELLDSLVEHVKKLHSYTVPEIIALPLAGGYQDYLQWVKDVTTS